MTATYARCQRCGLTVRTRHAPRATTLLRRHSCRPDHRRRPRDIQAIDRDGDEGTRRDCTHVNHHHDHGTRSAYLQDGCRCHPCRLANRTAQQARRRAIAYDRWQPFVDAEPVRTHITQLARAGIGLNRIAALSGVSRSALHALVYGKPFASRPPNRHVRAAAAHRILAILPSTIVPSGRIRLPDSTGSIRRLQALIALGWSMTRLARQLHRHPSSISRLLSGTTVTVATDHAIRALYDQLATRSVPITRAEDQASVESARRYASAHSWVTPDRWNNIDLDRHPRSTAADDADNVDRVAVERALNGVPVALTLAERRLATRQLTQQGLSLGAIAARLHTHARTISRYRQANGDPTHRSMPGRPARHQRCDLVPPPSGPVPVRRRLDPPPGRPGLARDPAVGDQPDELPRPQQPQRGVVRPVDAPGSHQSSATSEARDE